MPTIDWTSALQGVTPITGGAALPPATYRLRPVGGEGKMNSAGNPMFSLEFEVISGPMQGRKAFHNENLPTDNSDKARTRMGFFLGLLQAFGITDENLRQMFAGRAIDPETLTYLAQQIVASGRSIKGTCVPQKDQPDRVNWRNWTPDDGVEPEPPKQAAAASGGPFQGGAPGAPQFGQAPTPNGLPAMPQGAPQGQGAPGLPLGGFPGSGGMQPNPEPAWAAAPAAQVQQPQGQQFGGPVPGFQGQPNAQGQLPQPGSLGPVPGAQPPAQAPVQQDSFPGQQFPGQVNPANFPPQAQQVPAQQAQQAQQAPAQQQALGLPGMPQPGTQTGPAGLPQGGFPQAGGPPQANF